MNMQEAMLTDNEKELVRNLFVTWGNSSQEILSTMCDKAITFSDCQLESIQPEALEEKLRDKEVIIQEITFSGDALGSAFILQKKDEGLVLIDLIIGGDGTNVIDEFGELQIGIFSEITSQVVNSLIGIIANNTRSKVNIITRGVMLNEVGQLLGNSFVELSYNVSIQDKLNGNLWMLFPHQLIKTIASFLQAPAPEPEKSAPSAPPPPQEAPAEPVKISQPAVFSQLASEPTAKKVENINLILDIPVSIKAILGKSELSVRELIDINPGTVLELDKMAGEPVDLVVNDRLVARGEIIVIDEKFGVKVMDVLSKAERIYNLK